MVKRTTGLRFTVQQNEVKLSYVCCFWQYYHAIRPMQDFKNRLDMG